MHRWIVWTLAICVACAGSGDDEESGAPATGDTRVPVSLSTVRRDSLVESIIVTGRLEPGPNGSAVLTAPAAGVIGSVRVRVGDRVHAGTVVATEEVPELAADAAQKRAAAEVTASEAARQEALLRDGITSRKEADAARAADQQAQAAARAAQALLSRTRMTSPLAGRVQRVLVQRGERVDAGTPVAQVVALDSLDLVASVPLRDLARLKVGSRAEVREDAAASAVTGFVSGVAPGVDSVTGTGVVVIRIPNREGRLHPGAGATASIPIGVARDVLIVPDSALVQAGDSAVVFVMSADSVAHQRAVVRRGQAGHDVAVEGRLQAGDIVVTTGAFGLEEGMHVVPSAPAADRP